MRHYEEKGAESHDEGADSYPVRLAEPVSHEADEQNHDQRTDVLRRGDQSRSGRRQAKLCRHK